MAFHMVLISSVYHIKEFNTQTFIEYLKSMHTLVRAGNPEWQNMDSTAKRTLQPIVGREQGSRR